MEAQLIVDMCEVFTFIPSQNKLVKTAISTTMHFRHFKNRRSNYAHFVTVMCFRKLTWNGLPNHK